MAGRQPNCSSAGVATAILQIDIESLPPALTTGPQYDQAFILFRRRNTPVGQAYVAARDGAVDMAACRRVAHELINHRSWQWKLDDYLRPAETAAPLLPATVAICTRERPDDLARALHAMSLLRPRPAEVLVVDNNPASQRTREMVARFPDVRYVREDRPGLITRPHRQEEYRSE